MSQHSPADARAQRPNILWICTDQQRFDTLGCYGNPFVRTPNIDALAKQGVLFERAFCQSPVCTPSRGSFLTGRYPRTARAFFDRLDHAWMMKFLKHRIADPRMLRLIGKWLRAGVSEDGQWTKTTAGTPQGAVASPLLSNVYLHYVLDLWANQWRDRHAKGDVIIVRYADDFVMGFQLKHEAERFLSDLKTRVEQFGLSMHPEKTRLIEFGRFADQNRRKREGRKPETFDFLGFTHVCAKKHWSGGFIVQRRSIKKRLRAKLAAVKQALLRRRHLPIPEQGAYLRSVVQGFLNYHAVPGNMPALTTFRRECVRHWLSALRRRSQRHRMNWERFRPWVDRLIPLPAILHPHPNDRFYAKHPK